MRQSRGKRRTSFDQAQRASRPEMQVRAVLFIRSVKMLDLVMLALGVGFFALSVGYTIACDRL